jgi:4-hydroxyphenylpyruvate dioxygenase
LPSGILPLPFSTLEANLVELSLTVPGDKVFFYQVEDASKPSSPIFSKPMAPARMTWSRSSRLFPCEEGGFLPVARFTEALVRTGYKGWWSAEMFNVSLFDEDPECTRKHGVRGLAGMRKLWKEVAEGADKSKGQVSDETNVEAEGGNTHEAYWGSVSIPATVAAF